jgi:hypothetical protein
MDQLALRRMIQQALSDPEQKKNARTGIASLIPPSGRVFFW